jgi:uncharacterized protein (DUF1800 family)
VIRQAVEGKIAVPVGEPQEGVWKSQIAIEQQRRQFKGQQQSGMQDTAAQIPPDSIENQSAVNLEIANLIHLQPQRRYESLLKMQPGHIQNVVRALVPMQRPALVAGMSPAQRETVIALLNPRMVVVNEAQAVRLLEDVYSARQVQRVMTEFWLNHFNISVHKNEVEPYYLPQFEHDVVAPHALGRFEDLLDAVAKSPAMLLYLDNRESVGPNSLFALRREHPGFTRSQLLELMHAQQGGRAQTQKLASSQDQPRPGINENYGRELMELHTLGVDGGYTQQDVIEAAKVLTGWTVAPPPRGGGFYFDENRHEPGDKIVMGHRIKQDGENEGLELLHILATSPATAHFISTELAVRFVGDHPSRALVNRVAKTYLASDGNISLVLTAMIQSSEFWSASDNKIKTPLDYVISAARATDAEISQPYRLVSELRVMGMPLDGTQQPNGYSMMNDAWNSSSELVDRMNFALALASNRIPGVTVSLDQLSGEHDGMLSALQQEEQLEHKILHEHASSHLHTAILTSLRDTGARIVLLHRWS